MDGIEAFSINGEGTKERRGIQALLKAGTIDGISIPLDSAELRWDLPTDVQQFTALAHVRDSIPTSLLAAAQYKRGIFTPNMLELQMGAHQTSLAGASPVYWNNNSFSTDSLVLQGTLGTIRLSGGMGESAPQPFQLFLSDLDARWLNYCYRESRMQFAGSLEGQFILQSNFPNAEAFGNIYWSNAILNDQLLGNLNTGVRWTYEADDVYLNSTLLKPGKTTARISGHYSPKKDDLDVVVVMDELEIHPIEPILNGVLEEVRGVFNGSVRVVGPLHHWEADGEFTLMNPNFNIPVTGTKLAATAIKTIDKTRPKINK